MQRLDPASHGGLRVVQPEDRIERRNGHLTHLTSTAGKIVDRVMNIFETSPDLFVFRWVFIWDSSIPVAADGCESMISLKDVRNALGDITLRPGRRRSNLLGTTTPVRSTWSVVPLIDDVFQRLRRFLGGFIRIAYSGCITLGYTRQHSMHRQQWKA